MKKKIINLTIFNNYSLFLNDALFMKIFFAARHANYCCHFYLGIQEK